MNKINNYINKYPLRVIGILWLIACIIVIIVSLTTCSIYRQPSIMKISKVKVINNQPQYSRYTFDLITLPDSTIQSTDTFIDLTNKYKIGDIINE